MNATGQNALVHSNCRDLWPSTNDCPVHRALAVCNLSSQQVPNEVLPSREMNVALTPMFHTFLLRCPFGTMDMTVQEKSLISVNVMKGRGSLMEAGVADVTCC